MNISAAKRSIRRVLLYVYLIRNIREKILAGASAEIDAIFRQQFLLFHYAASNRFINKPVD